MEKKEFLNFCKEEFESRNFKRYKNSFYLIGDQVLCGISLQKSNSGRYYYINYFYCIGDYKSSKKLPSIYDSDITGRICVMSKTQTYQGKRFMTPLVEYQEYTAKQLKPFFDEELNSKILPPVYQGKKIILNNLNKLYFITLNREKVMLKLSGQTGDGS